MIKIEIPKDSKPLYILRENLKNELKPFVNKPIVNENDGRVAYLPSKNINKLSSEIALQKSLANGFSEAEHFATARKVTELYKKAIQKAIQKDIKHNEANVQIPRYMIAFDPNGKPAQALITLKETKSGIYKGNKIYTLELEEVAKYD